MVNNFNRQVFKFQTRCERLTKVPKNAHHSAAIEIPDVGQSFRQKRISAKQFLNLKESVVWCVVQPTRFFIHFPEGAVPQILELRTYSVRNPFPCGREEE